MNRLGIGYLLVGVLAATVVAADPAVADVNAPIRVTAVAGTESATVSWKDLLRKGEGLTQYTITASPGGASVTTTSSPAVVTGLTAGTEYTFRVTATDATGSSEPSAPSNPVVPAPAQEAVAE